MNKNREVCTYYDNFNKYKRNVLLLRFLASVFLKSILRNLMLCLHV